MKLKIVADRGVIVNQQVKQVTLPGREGKFMIKPKHADLVAILDQGEIVYTDEQGTEKSVVISSGFVEVKHEKTEVLAELKVTK